MLSDSADTAVQEDAASSRRTRVLFVCWGESIHARRRVQLFIDDPRFEVAVVSTYDYGFQGAHFFPLLAARTRPAGARSERVRPGWLSTQTRESLARLRNLLLLPREGVRSLKDARSLGNAVQEFQPDLLFLQTLQYPCYLAYFLPRRLPVIVTFWNGDLTHFARWTGVEMLAKKWLVRYGVRRADAITVNSQAAFDACLSLGARKSHVSLIRYPAADIELFSRRDSTEARRRLGIEASQVVLCPRGLGKFFNSDVIIDAMPVVLAQRPDTLFLFVSGVGGASEWARHMDRARALGVAGRLRWDGQVPWLDMPWYYSASDVMLSVMTADSCPNCMLEAMAAEVPVVMSDTPQNREWIEDGGSGFLVQPRDPATLAARMLELLQDQSVSRRFTRRCLEVVKAYGNARVNVPKIKDLVLRISRRSDDRAPAHLG
ncbi:MAG TPA: glycosyltransferase family 4 protein [Burkholderiales bacterium]|nr:glycosyltransferase family 4 protein [Burkholderiales bacterium]